MSGWGSRNPGPTPPILLWQPAQLMVSSGATLSLNTLIGSMARSGGGVMSRTSMVALPSEPGSLGWLGSLGLFGLGSPGLSTENEGKHPATRRVANAKLRWRVLMTVDPL